MKNWSIVVVAGVMIAGLMARAVHAQNVTEIKTYTSSISRDSGGPLDLKLEANYDATRAQAPVMVVMHQYSGTTGLFDQVRPNAQWFRDKGFFVVSVAMRGREGSDGVRDSGGLEVHDIYDAVQYVKTQYAGKVDPTSVSIAGYSGGGGNVMSALTKFPDTFRVGAAYFGMSDYGYNPSTGWYNNGANVGGYRTPQLNLDIGNPNTGGPAIQDRYLARASNLASQNNAYSEIHLFANTDEAICPMVNNTSYLANALAHATRPGQFDNIRIHPGSSGTYQDFNRNGISEPQEQQYWPHGNLSLTAQAAGDGWYVDRLLRGEIPNPQLDPAGDLFVAGYVRTRPFSLFLSDGQNAAGDLSYGLSATEKTFRLTLASQLPATGALSVDTSDMLGQSIAVFCNGVQIDALIAGSSYQYNAFENGQTLVVRAVPEPSLLLGAAGALSLLATRRRTSLTGASLTHCVCKIVSVSSKDPA